MVAPGAFDHLRRQVEADGIDTEAGEVGGEVPGPAVDVENRSAAVALDEVSQQSQLSAIMRVLFEVVGELVRLGVLTTDRRVPSRRPQASCPGGTGHRRVAWKLAQPPRPGGSASGESSR